MLQVVMYSHLYCCHTMLEIFKQAPTNIKLFFYMPSKTCLFTVTVKIQPSTQHLYTNDAVFCFVWFGLKLASIGTQYSFNNNIKIPGNVLLKIIKNKFSTCLQFNLRHPASKSQNTVLVQIYPSTRNNINVADHAVPENSPTPPNEGY